MGHPFLKNSYIVFTYIGTLLLIVITQFFLLYKYFNIGFFPAACDSVVFQIFLGAYGLSIWYAIKYSKPGEKTNFYNIISFILSLFVISFIWCESSVLLLNILLQKDANYLKFLENSYLWRLITGFVFFVIIVLIYIIIRYYDDLQEKQVKEAALLEKVKEAELNLLKSQINPHFLFNSLNSINSLTLTKPEKAQEMVIKLSDFLRYSITIGDNSLTLINKEIDNVHRYLDIEKVRFGSKLQYNFEIEAECQNLKIPQMILQPLYENAVKHGVYESIEPIMIDTKCSFDNGFVKINITNNYDSEYPSKKGAGIGLKNIKERMSLIYGRNDLVNIEKTFNKFSVNLIFPQLENLD